VRPRSAACAQHQQGLGISNTCGSISTANQEGRFQASCGGGGGQLRTFPNPTNNQLIVELEDPTVDKEAESSLPSEKSVLIAVPFTIELFDSQGTLRKSIKGESGTLIVDTSDLPNGIYYLHAQTEIERLTSQIIVKH
jgi:Secretion system C-terminal sorting domain